MILKKDFLKKIFFHTSKNPKYILFEILKELEFLVYLILFTPLLYIDRFIPIKKRIYFANFRSERIGHFSIGFYIRYAQKKLNLNKKTCLYCFSEEICNQFLAKQVSRTFFVNRIVRFIIKICKILPNLESLIDYEPINAARDVEGITQQTNMPIFSKKENDFCIEWLKSFGWEGSHQKIICVHVRDSAYIENTFLQYKYRSVDWSYHSYRDAKIEDFSESIEWLLKKGYFVIRTGKFANKCVSINSKNFIDYPFCNKQNDLIDIWIFANCDLVISTGSGIDEVSSAYKIPKINVNYLPLTNSQSWAKSLNCPKHLHWKKGMKHLDFNEYLELIDLSFTNKYDDLNLVIKDLTSKELLLLVREGCKYFLEEKPIKSNDIELTNIFKEYIKQGKIKKGAHKWLNNKWIISSNIFNTNKEK